MKKNNDSNLQHEKIIQKALRTGGFIFPENADEIIEFEKQFGNTDIILPEALKDLKFMTTKSNDKLHSTPMLVEQNLAMAAREGSELPDAIKERMKKDREKLKIKKT